MSQQAFVGREREVFVLGEYLEHAVTGTGQVCFVSGEAGTGKTALLRFFSRWSQDTHQNLIVAIGNCNAQTGIGDPYLPFREVLELLTGDANAKLAEGSITQENANRIKRYLASSGQILVEVAPDLIGTFIPGGVLIGALGKAVAEKAGLTEKLEAVSKQDHALEEIGHGLIQQSHIFEQYTNYLCEISKRHPLLLVLDDLHWADTASISLLFHLGRRIGESRILIVGTYRPVEVFAGLQNHRHPLEGMLSEFKRYYGDTVIDLEQTDKNERRSLVDALLDTEPNKLDDVFRETLLNQTGGNPLFTIELLRDMQESGTILLDDQGYWIEGPNLVWDSLPARVEGVIERRFGRLEDETREVLTVASVEGEEFVAEVIAKVLNIDERLIVRHLSGILDKRHRLVAAKGIQRMGSFRLSLYRFRHNLFQKYLYNSLDTVERAYLHEDIGNFLEFIYDEQTEEIAVQLARHFQEAGIYEKASDYYFKAGKRAIRLSANVEAIDHLRHALEMLNFLPDSPERTQQELNIQIALGVPLQVTNGPGALEVGEAYSRARSLSQQSEDDSQLIPALWGLWRYHRSRAEFQTARELADDLLALTELQSDPALDLQAHHAQWTTLFYIGEFQSALSHIEDGISLYSPQEHHSDASLFSGHDLGVCAHTMGAFTLWFLGYPDQALEMANRSLDLAHQLAHPTSISLALEHLAGLHKFRREVAATQQRAEELISIAKDQDSDYDVATGNVLLGWAYVEQRRGEEGLKLIQQGLAARRPPGTGLEDAHMLALHVEVLGKVGRIEEGLSLLEDVLATIQNTGQRFWEAELNRLKGELLFSLGLVEAEDYFVRAIEIATQQRAKSLELRAMKDLSHLWRTQGKQVEANQMLREVYDWFSEGFDTTDMSETKVMLDDFRSAFDG